MKNYCQCCGKYRFVKVHDGINLCAACVRKIREGKEDYFFKLYPDAKI